MRCLSCQRENAADASFCGGCGARLARACPDCGRANEPANRFCSGCGRAFADSAPAPVTQDVEPPAHLAAKILRDRAALEGERRTVTVLFIDAVASVAAGDRLDQEEYHRIVRQCTEQMVRAVHRFEGTVAQFRGDGIMALFGAPIAHEDTARRAISAALAMREALDAYAARLRSGGGRPFTYRIGLNSGPVIVGRIGDDLSMDYTAIGDTVNLAARMEQWAAPGKIYVTDQTRRLAAGHFEFADLGALEVKGKSEAVRAFEVTRELPSRTRLEIAADRGLTPYVGREHELGALRAHLDQAAAGRGQVVFVSGEAGIGKSRLLLEFRRSLEGEDVTWVGGQCISYGRAIPFVPIVGLLKQTFGVEESDADADIVRRIEERAAAWDDDTKRAAPYVRFLMNVDPGDERVAMMDPMERRAGILDALRALLIRGASQRPVVMVFEDLHWVDEKSEEAIAALADVAASARVLMILTYRPGYAHSLGDRTHYSRLALGHLAKEESATLLDRVLDAVACPEEVRRAITSKAEGNPFFIEEVTKALIESGVVRRTNGTYKLARPLADVHIPETIQEVILTRIDRLDREAREAMQLASVIGREFTVRLLDRISEAETRLEGLLGQLKALELIYEKAYFPELSYMFKHALTHDVAYSTLLLDRRKALHLMVGAAIEELYDDRLAEHYETLAYHYEQAEDWPKALEYLTKAAQKAEAAYANADAIAFYDRALHVYDRLPGHERGRGETLRNKGKIHITTGDVAGAEQAFRAGALASARGDDVHGEALSMTLVGMAQIWAHEFEEAQATIDGVLAQDVEPDVRAGAEILKGVTHGLLGELEAWAPYVARGPEIFAVCDQYFRGLGEVMRTGLFNWRGEYEEAKQLASTAEPSAADAVSRCELMWLLGVIHCGAGNYDRAMAYLRQEFELSERVGEALVLARAQNTMGWIFSELQDFARAIEWNERSVTSARDIGAPDPEIECNAWLNLADCYIGLGQYAEAEELLHAVERVVRDPRPADRWMLWSYAQHMCATAADLWLARDDADRALKYADECIERAVATGRPKNEVKGRRARGLALIEEGSLSEAEQEITRALQQALRVGNPPQIWKTYAALGELREAQHRDDDARAAFAEACVVIDGVARKLEDEALREAFLGSAAIVALREKADALTA